MGLKFWTVLIWGKSKAHDHNSCFLSQGTFIAIVRAISLLWQEPARCEIKSHFIVMARATL